MQALRAWGYTLKFHAREDDTRGPLRGPPPPGRALLAWLRYNISALKMPLTVKDTSDHLPQFHLPWVVRTTQSSRPPVFRHGDRGDLKTALPAINKCIFPKLTLLNIFASKTNFAWTSRINIMKMAVRPKRAADSMQYPSKFQSCSSQK
jgi:hypothetical protein